MRSVQLATHSAQAVTPRQIATRQTTRRQFDRRFLHRATLGGTGCSSLFIAVSNDSSGTLQIGHRLGGSSRCECPRPHQKKRRRDCAPVLIPSSRVSALYIRMPPTTKYTQWWYPISLKLLDRYSRRDFQNWHKPGTRTCSTSAPTTWC